MCSLYNEEHSIKRIFHTQQETIDEMIRLHKELCCVFVATNLHFDIFELFRSMKHAKDLTPSFRKSSLLFCRYARTKDRSRGKDRTRDITFIDTMNFLKMGVENLGEKLLKIPKLPKPSFLGKRPSTNDEWLEMQRYCLRDAEITQKTMRVIHDVLFFFSDLCEQKHIQLPGWRDPAIRGSKTKYTSAATALDNYRRFFMARTYVVHEERILDDLFQAYYGGRVEAYHRGTYHHQRCYDINSMYPYVMSAYVYPDPDSLQERPQMTKEDLLYEGVCEADVCAPFLSLPYLPHRRGKRLIFPVGRFSGWYTTFELREAIKLGYTVLLKRGYICTKTCKPFVEYVRTWYALRMKFREEGSPLEHVAKLLLNSLYGRFAMRNDRERSVVHQESMTPARMAFFQKNGFDVRMLGDEWFIVEKAGHVYTDDIVPLWSIYCTAYARHELYQYMRKCPSLKYVDTDSLICEEELPTSDDLGCLKLEKDIEEIIIVRPKMYAYVSKEKQIFLKIKGLPLNRAERSLDWFRQLLKRRRSGYMTFTKFHTALKRQLSINQIQEEEKEFSLEDEKRSWPNVFKLEAQQTSSPIIL